tara:strand:+ start:38 stop:178 length:141 start_codon:yes stop_codon:yes gene_type:complete
MKKEKEKKDKEIEDEKDKKSETNSGYCFVVMHNSTDAIPLHDNRNF